MGAVPRSPNVRLQLRELSVATASRPYGSQGNGYSIGFHSSTLLTAAKRPENNLLRGCTLRKVKYKQNQKTEMIQRRIDVLGEILEPLAAEFEPTDDMGVHQLLQLWFPITASFRPTLALMKHIAFEGEQEWRLVRTLWKNPVATADSPVQVRTIGGKLSPYLAIPWALPNTPDRSEVQGIKEVYCGPSMEPELKENAVHDLLRGQKCWNSQISRSKIPLRP